MNIYKQLNNHIIAFFLLPTSHIYANIAKYSWITIGLLMCVYPWATHTNITQVIYQPTIKTLFYFIYSLINNLVLLYFFSNNHGVDLNHDPGKLANKKIEEYITTSIGQILIVPSIAFVGIIIIINISVLLSKPTIIPTNNHHSFFINALVACILALNANSIFYLYTQIQEKNTSEIYQFIHENTKISQHQKQQIIKKIPSIARKQFIEQYIYPTQNH